VPNLYKLAWRKHRKVFEEVTNANWMRGLWRMSTVAEMVEFVELWDRVQQVQFTDNQDQMFWRWTANGEYTAKSAYNIQFSGSYTRVDSQVLWKAPMEGKHKFFAWLLVHNKILTADKMLQRNWNAIWYVPCVQLPWRLQITCACTAPSLCRYGVLPLTGLEI
jgi:hypothetical protein